MNTTVLDHAAEAVTLPAPDEDAAGAKAPAKAQVSLPVSPRRARVELSAEEEWVCDHATD